ncbi:hypothetical protein H0H93_008691 [Arthromyces matolae]|nr:hypothetical protein H0H93_008691 [Arthromyces matolae]
MSATKRRLDMEHTMHSNDSRHSRKVRKLDVTGKNPAILLFPGESAASPLDWCEFKDIIHHLLMRIPLESRPVIHNFARAGDTAEDDLASQLSSVFARLPPQNSTLEKDKVLFGKEIEFDNERCLTWNTELVEQAKAFAESASKASISVVSSHAVISEILDDPERYGLSDSVGKDDDGIVDEDNEDDDEDDSGQEPHAMWEDELHLSYAGHEKFAERLWHIFGSVGP